MGEIKFLDIMEFQESNMLFKFDKQWVVKKYDAHRFFAGLAGAGLKGVDFIAISPDKLLIMEIKNYRRRHDWQEENPFDKVIADPDEFIYKITDKVEDTLRGITAIGKYYRQKWWYFLAAPLLRFFKSSPYDWSFWLQVYEQSHTQENIIFIIWMETEQPQNTIRETLNQKISEQLKPLVGATHLTNCSNHPFQESIHASLVGHDDEVDE
jgi:hypothetical protein